MMIIGVKDGVYTLKKKHLQCIDASLNEFISFLQNA